MTRATWADFVRWVDAERRSDNMWFAYDHVVTGHDAEIALRAGGWSGDGVATWRELWLSSLRERGIEPPEEREPSRTFVPTKEQAMHNAMLQACWKTGLTEEQTIEQMFRRCQELSRLAQRLAERQPPPPIIIQLPETDQR